MATEEVDFELYRYTPNLAPAGILTALFFLTSLFHIYKLFKFRAWFFIPFVIGGIFQILGYTLRIPAHTNTDSVSLYAIHTLLILLAPPLYAASIYMTLSRVIVCLRAEEISLVPVKWISRVFVAGDVLAFLMQAAGGGIMATGSTKSFKTGEKITIGGLALQLVFFGAFLGVCGVFHYRMRRREPLSPNSEAESEPEPEPEPKPGQGIMALLTRPRHVDFKPTAPKTKTNWETILITLYTASMVILIRSIFRLVEYVQGNSGYLISHEVYMYVFDASLMVGVMGVLGVWYPGVALGGNGGGKGKGIGNQGA